MIRAVEHDGDGTQEQLGNRVPGKISISDLIERTPYPIIRLVEPDIRDTLKRGQDVIPCHIGGTNDEVHDVIGRANRITAEAETRFPYGPTLGIKGFSGAVSQFYERLYGIEAEEGRVLPTFGASEAIEIALTVIAGGGGEVLTPCPGYVNYLTYAQPVGARVVPIPTRFENGFALPPIEEIESLVNPNTRAILICDPDNPTARVLPREKFEELFEFAYQNGLALVLDRVYWNLVYDDQEMVNPFALDDEQYKEIIVICDSASKIFDLCGLRQGWLFALNEEFMANAAKLAARRGSTNTSAQRIVAQALREITFEDFSEKREMYQNRRDLVLTHLRQLEEAGLVELPPNPCQGAFYAYFRVKPGGNYADAIDLNRFLLSKKFMGLLGDNFEDTTTLSLTPGYAKTGGAFYFPGHFGEGTAVPEAVKSEVRLAYVFPKKTLEKAIKILKFALQSYEQRTDESAWV